MRKSRDSLPLEYSGSSPSGRVSNGTELVPRGRAMSIDARGDRGGVDGGDIEMSLLLENPIME